MDDVFAKILGHMASQTGTVDAKAQKTKADRVARQARIQADPELKAKENARQNARRHERKALVRGAYKVKPTGEEK